MADSIEQKLIDKRVAARYLRKGRLDERAWQAHLEALPDLAAEAITMVVDYDDEDEDFEDEEDDDEAFLASAAPIVNPTPPPDGTPGPQGPQSP